MQSAMAPAHGQMASTRPAVVPNHWTGKTRQCFSRLSSWFAPLCCIVALFSAARAAQHNHYLCYAGQCLDA